MRTVTTKIMFLNSRLHCSRPGKRVRFILISVGRAILVFAGGRGVHVVRWCRRGSVRAPLTLASASRVSPMLGDHALAEHDSPLKDSEENGPCSEARHSEVPPLPWPCTVGH